jgi:hypothetical protein
LSFFDEADEPQTRQRPAARRRSSSGGGRRPPTDRQAIQTRRAVAAIAALVILVLVILGVHSCQVSARNIALKDYNNSVASVVTRSVATGTQLFSQLSGPSGGASNAAGLAQAMSQTANAADAELKTAEGLSVPNEVKAAQTNLLTALQMRHDALVHIASNIQQALGTTGNKDAVNAIAAAMAVLYASDVMYKDYTLPQIISALNSALGSNNGEQQSHAQFVPSLSWLTPSYVASQIGATLPNPAVTHCVSSKIYGHSLDSVSVNGTTLQTGSTNSLPARPAPKFTLNFTNGGDVNEPNVKFKVTVNGTSASGQTTVPSTTAHASGSADVTLSSSPAAGTYTVVATIEKVPCETHTSNNSLSFPVSFQ